MNDIFLWIIMNGFFCYISYSYLTTDWYKKPPRFIIYISITALFVILNLAYYYLESDSSSIQLSAMIFITFILAISSIVFHFLRHVSIEASRLKSHFAEQQIDYYTKQLDEIKELESSTRRQRHELKNNYIAIESFAKKGDTDSIIEYVQKLYLELRPSDNLSHTGNFVIDALLNYKVNTSKVEGLKFNFNLNVPTELDINSTIFCGVLGNAIDNAIEASKTVSIDKRIINIIMMIEKHNLFIEINNPFDGFINVNSKGKLITRKENHKTHGFGMSVMEDLLNHNNGSLMVHWENNIFYLQVIMYHAI